jgi:hypothetical protein
MPVWRECSHPKTKHFEIQHLKCRLQLAGEKSKGLNLRNYYGKSFRVLPEYVMDISLGIPVFDEQG